ncbi:hypothetical protein BFP70_03440 [Thioclava sp. SK-1]|nr:hypothetical protein BFP70_03440 [Thioclava sp. SK-1]
MMALPPGMIGAELRDGWQTPDGARMAAIRVSLDKGWKTYWRNPGDAGIPPHINFAQSRNVADVKIHWPAPHVFEQNGMRSVGYKDEMILPIEITPQDPNRPMTLSASMDFGICDDICVPVSVNLDTALSGLGLPDPLISDALNSQPRAVAGIATCQIAPINDGMRVTARIAMPDAPGQVALFELLSQPVWISDPESHREGDILVAQADFVADAGKPFDLDPAALRITVLDHTEQAVEMNGCPRG